MQGLGGTLLGLPQVGVQAIQGVLAHLVLGLPCLLGLVPGEALETLYGLCLHMYANECKDV